MHVTADEVTRPLLPRDDPFYVMTRNLGGVAPGTVLRVRQVELALLGVVPQQVSAWQLLYRTADLDGTPEVSVTTVLLPAGADPAEQRPLLAFQCAIDAIADRCFPSYALRRGARAFGAVPSYEFLLVGNALRRGWAVSIADHGGIGGRFGAPREPGYRVLDGVRAALSFAPLGLTTTTPVALWGYSGGGMASSWAAEMAPEHAPELDIVGAVLGSPVGDPAETFRKLNGTLHAGLSGMVVSALRHTHPGLARAIATHFDFDGERALNAIARYQTVPAVLRFVGDDIGAYTDIPLADLLDLPDVRAVLDDIRLGDRAPECPLLVLQAVHDQIIGVDAIDGQVERYRSAGVHVTYVRDLWSEHLSLAALSGPAALGWLGDRFAGRALPASETTTVRSMVLTADGVRGLLDMLGVVIRTLAGRPIRALRPVPAPAPVVEPGVPAKAS